MEEIAKILSKNNVSETNAHQAGMYILKVHLSFFPSLSVNQRNPRITLNFIDEQNKFWKFDFIYYNNKFFENGTRDEYRLTPMNSFFSLYNIKTGDTITLQKTSNLYTYKIFSPKIYPLNF